MQNKVPVSAVAEYDDSYQNNYMPPIDNEDIKLFFLHPFWDAATIAEEELLQYMKRNYCPVYDKCLLR